MRNDDNKVYTLVLTGVFTALVMAATSFFKVPVAATNGYVHMGDAMVFLAVAVLGRKNGTIAGASGSALADLLGGYAHWVPWTFVIKGVMAFVCGTILYAGQDSDGAATSGTKISARSITAMSIGSLIMIAGYFTAHRFIYGTWAAPFAALPGNIIQGVCGVVIAEIAAAAIGKATPGIIGRQG